MHVAVTGAAGHVGGTLVRRLLDEGHTVRALMHEDGSALEGLSVERIDGDVRDLPSLRQAFDGAEIVYHCAARIVIGRISHEEIQKTNVLGPRNVAAACLDAKVRRLVHFSSVHAVASRKGDAPVDETQPRTEDHESPYDRSKALGEAEIRAAIKRGLDAVILNPTGIIGPNDFRVSRMGNVLLSLYNGTIPALVDGGFNWVDVRDVAAAATQAAERGRTGENYLLGGAWMHMRDYGRIVEELGGRRAPRLVPPIWVVRGAVPFVDLWAAITRTEPIFSQGALDALSTHRNVVDDKARKEIGHTSRPTRESIGDAIEWFRAAGKLRA